VEAGVQHAVRDAGLRIPEDIALIGYDETPWARQVAGRFAKAIQRALTWCLTHDPAEAPSVAELATRCGRTEEEVLEALDCASAYSAESLETPSGEDRTIGDSLGGEDPALGDVELHESLGPALATLAVFAFMTQWNAHGPAHHCAVGVGHLSAKIQKLALLLGLDFARIC
jgi:hypothetical protein